jgi:hypothetical protein
MMAAREVHATISPAYPIDLINKFGNAEEYFGSKLSVSEKVARLAVEREV